MKVDTYLINLSWIKKSSREAINMKNNYYKISMTHTLNTFLEMIWIVQHIRKNTTLNFIYQIFEINSLKCLEALVFEMGNIKIWRGGDATAL